MLGLRHRADVVTSLSPAIVTDPLWADDCLFPSTGIAFTDLPVSTTMGTLHSGLLGTDWGGTCKCRVWSRALSHPGLCAVLSAGEYQYGVPTGLFLSDSKAQSCSMTHSK